VMALAGDLRLAICVCSLSQRGLDDESLNTLLNTAPLRSIILLEDIDRAMSAETRVTMSGLLNALDGVAAQEGRLVFMTTNHVDRLDAALIRPGRADVKLEVGLLNTDQVQLLYKKFFPTAGAGLIEGIAKAIPPGKISAAQLQSHLFLYRDDEAAAVRRAASMLGDVATFEAAVRKQRETEARVRQRMDAAPPRFVDGFLSDPPSHSSSKQSYVLPNI